jgi:hypothetical protein
MGYVIRQSTAITVALGPFLDEDDGNTVEDGLTLTQPDIRLSKNGGAFAQKSAAQTLSHMENGYYSLSLSTTDTNTVGQLTVHVHEAGALPVWIYFQVVEEAAYDAIFAASAAPATAAGVSAVETDTQDIQGRLPAALVNSRIDATIDGTGMEAGAISAIAGGLNDPTAAAIADAVWEEAIGDHDGTGGSTAEALANAGAAGSPPTVEAIADAVWEEAIGDHDGTGGSTAEALANAGAAGSPPTVEEIADQVWDEALSGHANAGSAGKALADIEADTDELQQDDTPGAIAALENLSQAEAQSAAAAALAAYDPPTKAELDAGLGGLNDVSEAQVNAQVDAALADYDAPTKAELDAGLGGLNDVSEAQVNAQVDAALADYDAPTKAELDAGLAGLNDPTAAAIADAVWEEAIGDHDGTAGSTAEALAGAAAATIAGAGATPWVLTIGDGEDPIEGASVWVSTDAGGDNVVAGPLISDSFGDVTFLLDAGTYYAWVRSDGFNPELSSEFTVS